MRIPKEDRCRYCGRRILWIPGAGGRFPVEAELTPYRRARPGEAYMAMFGNTGARYERVVECTDAEADGFAHKFHFVGCGRPASQKRKIDRRPGMRR